MERRRWFFKYIVLKTNDIVITTTTTKLINKPPISIHISFGSFGEKIFKKAFHNKHYLKYLSFIERKQNHKKINKEKNIISKMY